MLAIVVTPLAQRDLLTAYLWYETQRDGLGDEFDRAVDDTFAKIAEMPTRFPEHVPGVRRAHVGKFPYSAMFRIEADVVRVLAVYGQERDPPRWDDPRRP